MYGLASDSEVAANVGLRSEPSIEKTRAWIERVRLDPDVHVFTVQIDGEYAGNVVFDQRDRYLNTARFSIYLKDRGRGVGTAAAAAAVKAIFEEWGLYKVWLTVHVDNARAIRCYEKVGFRCEGRHRGEFILRGERVDALYMGILASEIDSGDE